MVEAKATDAVMLAVKSVRRHFFVAGVYSFFINALMLVPSIYMMQVYDRVLGSRNLTTLLMITIIVLVMYGVMAALDWVRSQILVEASLKLDAQLRERVFDAVFTASLQKSPLGSAQALSDVVNIRQFLGGNGLFAFFDAPWAPIFLFVSFLLHPWFGIFSIGGAALLLGVTLLTERATNRPIVEANNASVQANVFLSNQLRNTEVVEAMGMRANIYRRWFVKHDMALRLQHVASSRAGGIGSIAKFTRMAQQSLILGLGAWLVIDGSISAGSMIAASILMGRVLSPVEQLIGVWKHLISARASYDRLNSLLAAYPPDGTSMSLPIPVGKLSLEGVSVAAPFGGPMILNRISFAVHPGQAVGVIGPSASGKSTLVKTIVGVWSPTSGHVRLDGADIHTWNRQELGPFVGYLPQDVDIYEGTIAENIARFSDVNAEQVVRAAQRAQIHDMILKLPNGYDTLIGAGGVTLSGGQRQRVGLARALYADPVLVVLDEPNSNLDDAGELALIKAINELKSVGRTVIVVTHRTSVLSAVDKLLVLKDGEMQLFGDKADVVNRVRSLSAAQTKQTVGLAGRG